MEYPSAFCAIRYLVLWHHEEERLHEGMKARSVVVLRDSLQHFGISRSFKDVASSDVAAGIFDAISEFDGSTSLNPWEKVVSLADRFNDDFKKRNLSAASKLLWLTSRHPYVIYDARAASALPGYDFRKKDYTAYWKAWRAEYERREAEIRDAAARLNELQPFVSLWHPSQESLTVMAQQPWFLERMFDLYLWDLGNKLW